VLCFLNLLHILHFTADENECLTNRNNCDAHAECINDDGSYQCVCNPGFQGNGETCARI